MTAHRRAEGPVMGDADQTTPRMREVSPRPAAFIVPWALTYSAGRATGVSDRPVALAHQLADRLTPDERRRIIDAAVGAQLTAVVNADGPMSVDGEAERLGRLIDTLEALTGPGDDEPLPAGSRRLIALVANSALRLAADPWRQGGDDGEDSEHPALCLAVAQLAPEFRASDRVLVLRDLAGAAEDWARRPEGEPQIIPLCFSWLYGRIMALPKDEGYARMNRLPEAI